MRCEKRRVKSSERVRGLLLFCALLNSCCVPRCAYFSLAVMCVTADGSAPESVAAELRPGGAGLAGGFCVRHRSQFVELIPFTSNLFCVASRFLEPPSR